VILIKNKAAAMHQIIAAALFIGDLLNPLFLQIIAAAYLFAYLFLQ
jgi:hypothetical protein